LSEGFAKAANPVLLDAVEASSLGWVWRAECADVVAPTELEAKADLPKAVEEENDPDALGNAGFPNALGCPKADVEVEKGSFRWGRVAIWTLGVYSLKDKGVMAPRGGVEGGDGFWATSTSSLATDKGELVPDPAD
jgi:hypothetical protein